MGDMKCDFLMGDMKCDLNHNLYFDLNDQSRNLSCLIQILKHLFFLFFLFFFFFYLLKK